MDSTLFGAQGTISYQVCFQTSSLRVQTTRGRSQLIRNLNPNTEILVCVSDGISVGALLCESEHFGSLSPDLHTN